MTLIADIKAREVLDSRGNPTVEADVILKSGHAASAQPHPVRLPGSREALELRDVTKADIWARVLKAVGGIQWCHP